MLTSTHSSRPPSAWPRPDTTSGRRRHSPPSRPTTPRTSPRGSTSPPSTRRTSIPSHSSRRPSRWLGLTTGRCSPSTLREAAPHSSTPRSARSQPSARPHTTSSPPRSRITYLSSSPSRIAPALHSGSAPATSYGLSLTTASRTCPQVSKETPNWSYGPSSRRSLPLDGCTGQPSRASLARSRPRRSPPPPRPSIPKTSPSASRSRRPRGRRPKRMPLLASAPSSNTRPPGRGSGPPP